ncbi:telomere-protecting terminal protein Tpg [Streptomyces maremycinicus]|uniref:telomere-protecting terminal protein Tpg n=1 Tax=Streptomyces maremycinicus TaxID=1679753 RepID=UPI000A7373FE|nr:hypothetical protein [Streptomyces sp. NBRC 110468]
MFTRPAPKSAKAQIEFLYTRAKKSTKALAEQLGVSPRTVQRYRAGQQTKPQQRLQAALVEETKSQWQPQVRAQARERAATASGMMVEVTAYFGFTCTGSSDDGRERTITTPVSPTYAAQILQLQEAVRRRRICIRSSRRPSPNRISQNWAPAPIACARISRTFRPSSSYSGAAQFRACYKEIRRVVVQCSGGGPF